MSASPVQLILLGPPGAGKGTQAAQVAARLGLVHISPGRILREEAAGDSPVGRELRGRMAEGWLVDDALVDRLVRERLESLAPGQGFILDGYPRTAAQARSLRDTLARLHRLSPRPLAVLLRAPPEVLVSRLAERAREQHRPDDSESAIRRRLEIDGSNTRALREELAGWAEVIDVDADQPPDRVTEEILRALGDQAATRIEPRSDSVFRSDR